MEVNISPGLVAKTSLKVSKENRAKALNLAMDLIIASSKAGDDGGSVAKNNGQALAKNNGQALASIAKALLSETQITSPKTIQDFLNGFFYNATGFLAKLFSAEPLASSSGVKRFGKLFDLLVTNKKTDGFSTSNATMLFSALNGTSNSKYFIRALKDNMGILDMRG